MSHSGSSTMPKVLYMHNVQSKRVMTSFFIACCVSLGINLNILPISSSSLKEKILHAINVDPTFNAILLIEIGCIFFLVYFYTQKRFKKPSVSIVAIALFFGFAMVFGRACEALSDPLEILQDRFNFFVTSVSLLSFSILGFLAYSFFANSCDRLTIRNVRSKNHNGFLRYLDSKPFILPFFILVLVWSPFLIAFFPGLAAPGDTLNQICQFFNYPEATSNSIDLINDSVLLNEHHPVVHTVLMGFCTYIGISFFSSSNIGYFIYILIQYFCVAATLSYGISLLKKFGVNVTFRFALLVFICLMPWFCEYALLGTKDTLFACSLLLLCLSLVKLCTNYSMKKLDWTILVVSLLGFCLLKKGYILFAIIIFLIMLFRASSNQKKGILSTFAPTLIIVLFISNFVFPTLQISPGSPREMLSIPAQQTANCVVNHGTEITDQQKADINKVFDYAAMESKYDPILSDPIKNTYNKYATKADLKNFFATWMELFLQHPDTCISATLKNYYGYFYPTNNEKYDYNLETSKVSFYQVNETLNIHHFDNSFTNSIGKLFSFGQEIWNHAPYLSMFTQGATYIWALVFLLLYSFQRKKPYKYALIPVLLVALITLIGPCNYIVRYIFPIAFVLPFLFLLVLFYKVQDYRSASCRPTQIIG